MRNFNRIRCIYGYTKFLLASSLLQDESPIIIDKITDIIYL